MYSPHGKKCFFWGLKCRFQYTMFQAQVPETDRFLQPYKINKPKQAYNMDFTQRKGEWKRI